MNKIPFVDTLVRASDYKLRHIKISIIVDVIEVPYDIVYEDDFFFE